MSAWTTEDIQNAVRQVGEKASRDQAFRALVIDNPHEAIRQVTGQEVPDGYRLTMIEADPEADMTFVIPDLQTDELSDTELDQVAGGRACNRDCPGLESCNTYLS